MCKWIVDEACDPKTDLSHNEGNRTPAQGAEVVVRYATLGADGPTGGFFGEKGALPW